MIIVVSGLPRSGTSLMMQILNAGGIEVLTDDRRKQDDNNPRGYYEYEKVKSLTYDNSWLREAEGKAIKVITQLIPYLPNNFEYKIIFMKRNIDEILKSQSKMLTSMSRESKMPIDILRKTFLSQNEKVISLLIKANNCEVACVQFKQLFNKPGNQIKIINDVLKLNLDIQLASNAIDKNLYRTKIEQ